MASAEGVPALGPSVKKLESSLRNPPRSLSLTAESGSRSKLFRPHLEEAAAGPGQPAGAGSSNAIGQTDQAEAHWPGFQVVELTTALGQPPTWTLEEDCRPSPFPQQSYR